MPEERGGLGDSWAFTKSLGSGAWDAGAGLVEGVGELVKGGYALATDEKAREAAWNTTKKLAKAAGDYGEEVWDDPAKAYRDARDGTLAAYNRFEQAKEQAAAEGRSAEFWGDLTGRGVFEVGSILIPAGVAAKAGKLKKVASVADDVVANPVIKAADDVVSSVGKCPIKNKVPDSIPKKIHPGQQGKHIPGHNNFTPGRSPLAEGVDAQKLLDGVHSGAYPIVRMTPRNQPVVDFGKAIGEFEGKATQFGIIHHGKKGAHIVPANPVQF